MRTRSSGSSKLRNTGSGPGAQTPDGCSVEFYRRLPAGGEISKVIEARPPPGTLLELGAGCGRLTLPLIKAGYDVTAVDNSVEMLEYVRGARTVNSDIESLRLDKTFDIVLLASRVLNCPDKVVRDLMLQTARTHLDIGDVLLLEVHSPDILRVREAESSANEHYAAEILSCSITGPKANICIEYSIGDDLWRHSFETEYLSPDTLESSLMRSGLEIESWMDSEKSWIKAVAV